MAKTSESQTNALKNMLSAKGAAQGRAAVATTSPPAPPVAAAAAPVEAAPVTDTPAVAEANDKPQKSIPGGKGATTFLSFRVPPEVRQEVRMIQAVYDLSLTEVFLEAFEMWKKTRPLK